jgi:hypothetical protein
MSAFDSIITQEFHHLSWGSPGGASGSIDDDTASSNAFDLKRLLFLHHELMEKVEPKPMDAHEGVLQRLVNEFQAWHERIRDLRDDAACQTAQVIQDVSVLFIAMDASSLRSSGLIYRHEHIHSVGTLFACSCSSLPEASSSRTRCLSSASSSTRRMMLRSVEALRTSSAERIEDRWSRSRGHG